MFVSSRSAILPMNVGLPVNISLATALLSEDEPDTRGNLMVAAVSEDSRVIALTLNLN